jgi:hypothetical protein
VSGAYPLGYSLSFVTRRLDPRVCPFPKWINLTGISCRRRRPG